VQYTNFLNLSREEKQNLIQLNLNCCENNLSNADNFKRLCGSLKMCARLEILSLKYNNERFVSTSALTWYLQVVLFIIKVIAHYYDILKIADYWLSSIFGKQPVFFYNKPNELPIFEMMMSLYMILLSHTIFLGIPLGCCYLIHKNRGEQRMQLLSSAISRCSYLQTININGCDPNSNDITPMKYFIGMDTNLLKQAIYNKQQIVCGIQKKLLFLYSKNQQHKHESWLCYDVIEHIFSFIKPQFKLG